MSENAAPENEGPGDGLGGSIADGRVRRAALLTAALAEDCAIKMFTERADGPHPLNIDPVAAHPTPEEVEICQAAVLGAIGGDKGSEKRARANRLCADGLIDLEQGLGYVLADRFGGWMPMPLEARGIGKRAADRLADKKEKERWKDKAQAARKAARKAGADEAAVAAAGQRARTKAEAAFKTAEAKISGLRAGGSELQPAPPTPRRATARAADTRATTRTTTRAGGPGSPRHGHVRGGESGDRGRLPACGTLTVLALRARRR